VYGRHYAGRDLRFEASGGLLHAALVMRDKETGSYWPILAGEAASGKLEGTRLLELPGGTKVQWKDWRRAHPDTLVLSVGGAEHVENNPYDQYFASDSGFREAAAKDKRLPTKEPIWAFDLNGRRFAVPFRTFEDGDTFRAGEEWVFLHRPKSAAVYFSSRAFASATPFVRRDGAWLHEASGARFDAAQGTFVGGSSGDLRPLRGFDTFWYMWSLTHPDTVVLGARAEATGPDLRRFFRT
jgi:hypothetical protein